MDGIRREFRRSIDEYLALCRENEVEPTKHGSSGLLVAASGSMATFLDAIGGQWGIGFGLAIAALIAADFMFDYATKIAVLSSHARSGTAVSSTRRSCSTTRPRSPC